MYIEDNMLVIRESKTFDYNFGLLEDVDKNFKHEIQFNIKRNNYLAEYEMNYCPNISMEIIFMNTENNKTSKPHK